MEADIAPSPLPPALLSGTPRSAGVSTSISSNIPEPPCPPFLPPSDESVSAARLARAMESRYLRASRDAIRRVAMKPKADARDGPPGRIIDGAFSPCWCPMLPATERDKRQDPQAAKAELEAKDTVKTSNRILFNDCDGRNILDRNEDGTEWRKRERRVPSAGLARAVRRCSCED
eukprot:CAMPEP_0183291472 /NCGR_PEP_ID=MMETSP0160_2-20130417/884_1 /TAXON_ID=2839 ORGANISM="Odontella Sinensis, Strain Grunow 1884" /NCGR_SAMPLE_ID=MMETSP0160_2 /ASSEMBLY_ACC=CAM_ASM_000250 /LENGTH=174 /DNA_ID=CAMNT_0025452285 /DNA_START=303 /DNA_END=824 /DNA_ORIENTATION=+